MSESFTYDNLNRLYNYQVAGQASYAVNYSNNGNITSRTDAGQFSFDPCLSAIASAKREHYDIFGLIDMNGRMGVYPAESGNTVLGRFLGVDPIIQDAGNSQNLNGYGYCLNNPLKYTDPSGYDHGMILRDWEREQRNDPGPTIMYNNYVDWWVQMQDASARMPWVNYLSSDFTSQFPNATISYGSMNGTTFIFGVNGTSTGYWSPTRSRTTKIYNEVTTTLEEKFTYHCPGEVEMSSYYILSINLNSGFWDPGLETRELDNTLSLGELMFAAGKGISQSQINSGIKALQNSGKASLPYFTKGGRFLGWINVGIDLYDFRINSTWGNGVKVGLDIGSMAPYGWIYGVVDLGFAVFSNASLTDRIGSGIDSFLNKNGGIMVPLGNNGYILISNYNR